MKKHTRVIAIGLTLPTLSFALIPVIDAIQEIHSFQQLAHEVTEIADLEEQVQQMIYNASHFGTKGGWRGFALPTVLSGVQNIAGETAGWNEAVNMGASAVVAWKTASMNPYPMPWVGIGGDVPTAAYATDHILAGASETTMTTLANAKGSIETNELAVTALERTAQDGGDGTNSEVDQLNLITSGTVLTNRQQKATNQLLTTLAEQQLAITKVYADSNAGYVDENARANQYLLNGPANWGGTSATIQNYKQ